MTCPKCGKYLIETGKGLVCLVCDKPQKRGFMGLVLDVLRVLMYGIGIVCLLPFVCLISPFMEKGKRDV